MHEQLNFVLTHLRSAWRFRWPALAVAWLICLGGWFAVARMPDIYEANARVFVDTTSQLRQILSDQIIEPDVAAQLNYVREALLGQTQLERVANATGLALRDDVPDDPEGIAIYLRDRIQLAGSGRGSDQVYVISYRDVDREMALAVVRILLDTFVEDTLGQRRQGSDDARRFLVDQARDVEERLALAEQRLADFKREHADVLPGREGGYFQRLQAETEALEQRKSALELAQSRLNQIRRQLRGGGGGGGSLLPTVVDERIREQEQRLEELLLVYTDRHPDVVAIKGTIERLKTQKAEQSATLESGTISASDPVYQALQISQNETLIEIASLTAEVNASQERVDRLRSLMSEVPEVEAQLARLDRDYGVVYALYKNLVESIETERLTREVSETDQIDFRVINPPSALQTPVEPSRPRLLVTVFGGALAAAAGVAFLLSQAWPVFPNARTLRDVVQLPVLGVVSLTWEDRHRARRRMAVFNFGVACAGLFLVFAIVILTELVGPGLGALMA